MVSLNSCSRLTVLKVFSTAKPQDLWDRYSWRTLHRGSPFAANISSLQSFLRAYLHHPLRNMSKDLARALSKTAHNAMSFQINVKNEAILMCFPVPLRLARRNEGNSEESLDRDRRWDEPNMRQWTHTPATVLFSVYSFSTLVIVYLCGWCSFKIKIFHIFTLDSHCRASARRR